MLIGADALTRFATLTPAAASFAAVGAALTAGIVCAGAVFTGQAISTAVRATHTRVRAVVRAILAGAATALGGRKEVALGYKIVLFKVSFKHNF